MTQSRINPFICCIYVLSLLCLSSNVSSRPLSNRINKRNDISGHLHMKLEHIQQTYYATTLQVGTPPQNITVLLDSGSSDFWLMDSKNPFCMENYCNSTEIPKYNNDLITQNLTIDCSYFNKYNPEISSTYQKLPNDNSRFYLQYTDGSFEDGIWSKETVQIDNYNITSLQLAVANYATTPVGGLLGISFPRRESVKGYDGALNEYYPNFPQVLKNENIIDIVLYSMYLNDLNQDGSLLFGAIDTSKFEGDMITYPMVNVYPNVVDKPATLALTIQGVAAQNTNDCTQNETFMTSKFPVLLDSGTTLMSAPKELADKMADFVNATYSEDDRIYILNCPSQEVLNDIEYIFDFGGLQVKIPLEKFILPSDDGSGPCAFGVLPETTTDRMVLGDIFLSFVYAVFDLDHYQISLANINKNANSESNEDSIINIPSNGAIPGAKVATVKPWSTHEPITVTTNIVSSCKAPSHSTIHKESSSKLTDQSTATATSVNIISKSTNIVTSTPTVPSSQKGNLKNSISMKYVTKTETALSTVLIGVCSNVAYTKILL
ncbi:aspartyl protease BAR1 NDAI_0B01720 [Naumovozyma dairenensis CBS 421]|uniref:Peptidase A1 domain-containing protein n=1 Tax=Naumovozyma dairenensis (strain ATCC 10597 / BCRC 20456 / CBS 421 / NBRC 0211 / NRRL Y-12639) TaxID=1071378 RepID=G0W5Z5_NAUDC|nr:hypothetical protein NDAI_0B01720 [Naumovozyma dairenensis CBS 421]CCD23206.1 hypothetical protein NDAI_0B01720 [Naumovozyma dairenensis CBS 421]